MAWRFKVSKFKNAAPKFPSKEDAVQDIPVQNIGYSCGNHIKASCVYVTFNTDFGNGGSLGYLPLNAKGRVGSNLPFIHAHGDFVTDFAFSPFDDYMLATGSQDNSLKVWLLPEVSDSKENLSDPVATLKHQNSRIENVLWHPTAEGVLAASTDKWVKIFDVTTTTENLVSTAHGGQVQSISWKNSGSLLASTCKDKYLRTMDLRSNQVVQEVSAHQSVKDTRVVWLGDSDFIVSTGFSSSQGRELKLWDIRNLQSSVTTMGYPGSTGALMCFYDQDTSSLYLAGLGDSSLHFLELTEKSPYLTEGSTSRTEQIRGAALVPKRAVELMAAEVNRLVLLVPNSILSVPYIVPRKSYREFHDDLYPETNGGEPALPAGQWFSGQDALVSKIKLVPGARLINPERRGSWLSSNKEKNSGLDHQNKAAIPQNCVQKPEVSPNKPSIVSPKATDASVASSNHKSSIFNTTSPPSQKDVKVNQAANDEFESQQPPAEASKVFKGVRQSKYRYIVGKALHPSLHITNIKNLCKTIPGDSDFFAANLERCAVPLEGAGGIIAVLELNNPCRLGETSDEIPTIQNGSKVADFVWDPFDNFQLVVGEM